MARRQSHEGTLPCGKYLHENGREFVARCTQPAGREHDHSLHTAREAVRRRLAEIVPDDEKDDLTECAGNCGDTVAMSTAFTFDETAGDTAPAGYFCEDCYLHASDALPDPSTCNMPLAAPTLFHGRRFARRKIGEPRPEYETQSISTYALFSNETYWKLMDEARRSREQACRTDPRDYLRAAYIRSARGYVEAARGIRRAQEAFDER